MFFGLVDKVTQVDAGNTSSAPYAQPYISILTL